MCHVWHYATIEQQPGKPHTVQLYSIQNTEYTPSHTASLPGHATPTIPPITRKPSPADEVQCNAINAWCPVYNNVADCAVQCQ